jgi:hypothetical protein
MLDGRSDEEEERNVWNGDGVYLFGHLLEALLAFLLPSLHFVFDPLDLELVDQSLCRSPRRNRADCVSGHGHLKVVSTLPPLKEWRGTLAHRSVMTMVYLSGIS